MNERRSARGWIIGAIVVIVVVALAAWWYFSRMPGLDTSRHGPAPSAPAAAASAAPAAQYPIAEASSSPAPASTAPLPPLESSDQAVVDALSALPGAGELAKLLVARGLVPHIVATVDALPRRGALGSTILPLRTPQGSFKVDTSGPEPVIANDNQARYATYMRIVEASDPQTLVSWYVHWYPLFQQAYRELGYPQGHFNDRVVTAINDMLAAPNVSQPVRLVRMANQRYAFADPTWESLSVGQKLMIRLGPENERAVKAKLRSIRALLLGKAPGLAPAGAATAPASPQS